MKALLLSITFLTCIHGIAQDQIVCRIICADGNASVDNVPIEVGQRILSAHKKMLIPRGSFVGVITSAGNAYKLNEGSYDISSLEKFIHEKKHRKIIATGAVHRAQMELLFYGVPYSKENTFIFGDTLSLKWEVYHGQAEDSYTVNVSSMWDDPLLAIVVKEPAVTMSVKSLLQTEPAVIIVVNGKTMHSGMQIVKSLRDEQRPLIQQQLDRIVADSPPEREMIRTAIFDIFNLHYDVLHQLYEKHLDASSLADDLKNYYAELVKQRSKTSDEF